VRLGRKEGIEDAVNMSLVDPASGILDREAHACLFVGRCLDRQQALAPGYGTHRIGGIHDQVEQHLLQRHAFARDFRQGLGEFAAEDDLPSFQVAVNECENFAYQIVDAE